MGGGMKIRDAGFTDVKKIARMYEEIRGRSRYSGVCPPMSTELCKAVTMDAIMAADRGEAKVLVIDDDGEMKGIFVGMMKRLYEVTDIKLAICAMWNVGEDVSPVTSLRLAKRFVDWAEQADGPLFIRIGLTDAIYEPDDAARALEKTMGFRKIGFIMEKEKI